MAMVKRECKWCGNIFAAREADVKRGWDRTCSKSCAARLREKKTGNFARYCYEEANYDH